MLTHIQGSGTVQRIFWKPSSELTKFPELKVSKNLQN